MDDKERALALTVASTFASWGIPARVVEDGLVFDPPAIVALIRWFGAELEHRSEMMELAHRVRELLVEALRDGLSPQLLNEMELVMMRYQLAAQEDKERFGLGTMLDLFNDPPADT